MALGANRMDVQRVVLRGAFLAIGIPCAIEGGHLMAAAELFGVNAANPLVLRATVVVPVLSALLAASLPARRARYSRWRR